VMAKDKNVIDKNINAKKRSYSVLKGKVTHSETIIPLYCSSIAKDFDFIVRSQINIKQLPRPKPKQHRRNLRRNELFKMSLAFLKRCIHIIENNNDHLVFIEKNCLLTRKV
jgi:hypothetical protein